MPPSGFLPDTDEWHGRGNFVARADNDYLIDRQRQKTVNFTGMEDSTPVQDAAMQESMGAIVDRSREHLSASDAAIICMRRRLLAAAETLAADGTVPPGVVQPHLYAGHGAQMLVHNGKGWGEAYAALMAVQYGEAGGSKPKNFRVTQKRKRAKEQFRIIPAQTETQPNKVARFPLLRG